MPDPLTDAGLRQRAEQLLKGITPGEWFAADWPSQGWTVCWKQDVPICHMRWTDGLRPEVEARIKAEAEFIAAAPQLVRDLLAAVDQIQPGAAQECAACQSRLAEVEHWVTRYNELEQWRIATRQRAAAAERRLQSLQQRVQQLEGVLRDVELVINPRDREGISLHEWGRRLRVATAQIFASLTQPGAAGQEE